VTPATATILVDGQRSGTGSLTQLEVTAGLRRVQISAPGYATVDTMIAVNPGAGVHIGQITLRSAPARP
jgi:PEGA domain